ncbi:MAG TPA: branched-chain amino acid ABC transporter substrate-binding protein [Vicinamibacterales bacterium]
MRKRFFMGGAVVAIAVGVSLAMVGIAGSATKGATPLPASSCSPLQYKGSGSPDFIVASDLPLQGSSRAQTIEVTKAEAFELQSNNWMAGKYHIGYQSCDDSTASAGTWDAAKCAANAGVYARNKSVLGVLGTFNSGCAEIEVPIANRAALQYVSPANTYIGLTHRPAKPGEPQKYYPTGKRTYARVVAADDYQGAADVLQLKALGVKSVYILNDNQAYGFGVASAVKNVANGAKNLGVKVLGFEAWDPKASSYSDLATKIKASGAQAVFLGGLECENGGKLIKDLRAGLGPKVVIEAPDGFSSFTSTIKDAGSASNGMFISIAGEPYANLNAAGKAFDVKFGKSIGLAPSKVNPYSNYGATAMLVMLHAIASSHGTRAGVSNGVYHRTFPNTPIGTFQLNQNGDTNAGVISFYVVKGQNAPFLKIISPPASLVALAKP